MKRALKNKTKNLLRKNKILIIAAIILVSLAGYYSYLSYAQLLSATGCIYKDASGAYFTAPGTGKTIQYCHVGTSAPNNVVSFNPPLAAGGYSNWPFTVTNTGSKPVFIPLKTYNEWDKFKSSLLTGVTKSDGCTNGLFPGAPTGTSMDCGGTQCCQFGGGSCPYGWQWQYPWSETTGSILYGDCDDGCSDCPGCTQRGYSWGGSHNPSQVNSDGGPRHHKFRDAGKGCSCGGSCNVETDCSQSITKIGCVLRIDWGNDGYCNNPALPSDDYENDCHDSTDCFNEMCGDEGSCTEGFADCTDSNDPYYDTAICSSGGNHVSIGYVCAY